MLISHSKNHRKVRTRRSYTNALLGLNISSDGVTKWRRHIWCSRTWAVTYKPHVDDIMRSSWFGVCVQDEVTVSTVELAVGLRIYGDHLQILNPPHLKGKTQRVKERQVVGQAKLMQHSLHNPAQSCRSKALTCRNLASAWNRCVSPCKGDMVKSLVTDCPVTFNLGFRNWGFQLIEAYLWTSKLHRFYARFPPGTHP